MFEIGSNNFVLSLKTLLLSSTFDVFSTFPVGGAAALAIARAFGVASISLFNVF